MPRLSRLTAVGALTASSVIALSAFFAPAPAAISQPPAEVVVRVDSVGTRGVGAGFAIRIYADGPARIGVGTSALAALTDTLQLRGLPAFSVDVSESDVHIELVAGNVADRGTFFIGGSVTGGPATRLAASGRHLVLLKGGTGVQVVDSIIAR
ncbi:MAG: hypothetical protein V4617_10120 [Gemmatimonadota bacterium]